MRSLSWDTRLLEEADHVGPDPSKTYCAKVRLRHGMHLRESFKEVDVLGGTIGWVIGDNWDVELRYGAVMVDFEDVPFFRGPLGDGWFIEIPHLEILEVFRRHIASTRLSWDTRPLEPVKPEFLKKGPDPEMQYIGVGKMVDFDDFGDFDDDTWFEVDEGEEAWIISKDFDGLGGREYRVDFFGKPLFRDREEGNGWSVSVDELENVKFFRRNASLELVSWDTRSLEPVFFEEGDDAEWWRSINQGDTIEDVDGEKWYILSKDFKGLILQSLLNNEVIFVARDFAMKARRRDASILAGAKSRKKLSWDTRQTLLGQPIVKVVRYNNDVVTTYQWSYGDNMRILYVPKDTIGYVVSPNTEELYTGGEPHYRVVWSNDEEHIARLIAVDDVEEIER